MLSILEMGGDYMVYELNPSQFNTIAHLLEGKRINLEIRAVVEGFNPGWVFVDNVMTPSTAMVWSNGIKGFYFLGDVNSQDFNDSLDTYIKYIIAPRIRKMSLSSFEFSGTSPKWDKKLAQIFKGRSLEISKQFVYKLADKPLPKTVENDFNESYSIKEVNSRLLNDDSVNTDLVKESVLEWWGTLKNFNKNGMGYCIVHDKEAVCSCVASSYDGREVQSHIVTKEDYRKKGLATMAVVEFVKESKNRDLNLYWDCMEKNLGSIALAEKIGYKKDYEYTLYEFPI